MPITFVTTMATSPPPQSTDSEDNKYDLLIEGTGLAQSILAAATSRLSKKVIHIDKNTFYGSYWSSLSIDQLDDFVKQRSSSGPSASNVSLSRYGFENYLGF